MGKSVCNVIGEWGVVVEMCIFVLGCVELQRVKYSIFTIRLWYV